jgi:hypothetical protein
MRGNAFRVCIRLSKGDWIECDCTDDVSLVVALTLFIVSLLNVYVDVPTYPLHSLLTDVEEHQRVLDTRQGESEQRIKRLEWQLEEKLRQLNSGPVPMHALKSTDSVVSPGDGSEYDVD